MLAHLSPHRLVDTSVDCFITKLEDDGQVRQTQFPQFAKKLNSNLHYTHQMTQLFHSIA